MTTTSRTETETVSLNYVSQLSENNLAEKLCNTRQRDLILGYTSSGIHKDELEMNLGSSLIRKVGSQGQNKTFLIALKLAQFSLLAENGKTSPILLLDDIFDKLDAMRVEQIIKLVSGDSFGQIFITDTNRKYLDAILAATAPVFPSAPPSLLCHLQTKPSEVGSALG